MTDPAVPRALKSHIKMQKIVTHNKSSFDPYRPEGQLCLSTAMQVITNTAAIPLYIEQESLLVLVVVNICTVSLKFPFQHQVI